MRGLYRDDIGVCGVRFGGYIGIMEKKLETTIQGLGLAGGKGI